jgi:hypothetical protein
MDDRTALREPDEPLWLVFAGKTLLEFHRDIRISCFVYRVN